MRTLTATTATALLLAITACGGGDQERIDELEAEVESLQQELDEAQSTPDVSGLFTEAEDEFNSRMDGAVQASIGEPVEVDLGPYENENNFAATVTLSAVEFSDTCVNHAPTGETSPSEAGQFASLTWDIDVDADADNAFDFNTNAFRWDDYHYALSTPTSLDCELDLGHQDPIEPGESGQYTAIWDVPTTTAELQWMEPTYIVTWTIDGDESESGEGAEEGTTTAPDDDVAESSGDNLPSADEVDFYGPIGHPLELQVDIKTIENCETADIIWGGLMNGEMEGFDIDTQYLAELEDWMQGNGCW